MKITAKFHKHIVEEDLASEIERLLHEGAREFIKSAQDRVPVLTGQAKGTFMAASEFLGILHELDFTPNSPHIDQREELMNRGQTPEAGKGYGEFSSEINPYLGKFHIANSLRYYQHWEFNSSPRGRGNWLSFREGRAAFLKYIRNAELNALKITYRKV